MPFQSEEERIREVLRDLKSRKEGGDVKEDIERIERILRDPLFKQLSNQRIPSNKPYYNVDSENNWDIEKRIDQLKYKFETSEAKKKLKATQKFLVVGVDVKKLEPVLLETKEKTTRLLIVGPKDIKSRSSGKLRIGDCVVAIDAPGAAHLSTSPTFNINHQSSSTSAIKAGDSTLTKQTFEQICRSSSEASPSRRHLVIGIIRESTPMVLSGDWTQVEVIRLSTETGGLGFGIVGGTSTGVVVKTILPGSPADKDGRLQPGDHILQVGSVNTHGMSSQQVATILRHQHPIVEMIVGRPIAYADKPIDTPDCFTLATKAALCATTLEEALHRQMATSVPSTAANVTPNTMSPSVSCTPIEEEKEGEAEPTTSATAHLQQDKTTNTPKSPTDENRKKPPDYDSIDLRKPCECAPSYNRREGSSEEPLKTTTSVLNVETKNSSVENGIEPSTTTLTTAQHGVHSPRDSDSKAETAEIQSEVNSPTDGPTTESLKSSPSTSKISLKSLQEMALAVFLRENWQNSKYELIDVILKRDPALGLGITVAGYVHKKEEIGGIFVKSLVPRSAASSSGSIKVHDLILEVNGTSLEHMSHADSVRTLVKSGDQVKMKLVRFPPSSPQAQCLKMLQQQETETQVIDVKLSNPNLINEWKSKLADEVEIVTAVVKPDRQMNDGGLGISLEGTVDVLNGAQLCPHHYIESIRENGPVAKTGLLQAGDELLQVNHSPLYGESHVTVRQALTRAVHSGAPVTLIVARRSQKLNVFEPSNDDKQLPLAFPFLAANQEALVKAKSDIDLSKTRHDTTQLLHKVSRRLRSRSLENFHGLAVWNCVPLVIYLNKDHRGLGFSIVDYKDPTHSDESVIVVQSLVPGGVAQIDGRIVPGDRLLFVNNHDLSNSSLERAVAVLKAARMGPVRLGIAKPVPVDQQASHFTSHSPLCSRSERLLARGRSPRGRRRYTSGTTSSQETVWIGTAEQYRRLHPQGYYPSRSPSARSERSLATSDISMTSWSPCSTRSVSPCGSPLSLRGSWAYDVIFLPSHLERSIKIQKGPLPLGIVLDADRDKGVNGCVIKSICGKKAIAMDGRLQVGDFIVKINTESLRNVTCSQARAILKRENLTGSSCCITYITSADAKTWKERFQRPSESSSPVINRLSPKVFPKFYRSPYLSRQDSVSKTDMTDDETEAPSIMSDSISEAVRIKETESEPIKDEDQDRKEKINIARLIDGVQIDEFVHKIIEEAIDDATIELNVLHKTRDWSEGPSNEKPPQISNQPEKQVEEEQTVVFRKPQNSLLRRDSEPPLHTPEFNRNSQLHILSTAEEVENVELLSKPLNGVDSGCAETIEQAPRLSTSVIQIDDDEPGVSLTAPTVVEVKAQEDTVEEKQEEKIEDKTEDPIDEKKEEAIVKSDEGKSTPNMSKITTRTPSTGSETLQNQVRQLARSKYWGEARTVVLNREPNKSFGISIVGGRVEVSQKGGLPGTGNTVCGIFIKSVLPNSPAGRSGQMNMGDRVISVNDIDLREATHEQAVNAIKNASNPVRFVLQSLHTNPKMNNSASNSTVGSVRFENEASKEPVYAEIQRDSTVKKRKSLEPEPRNVATVAPTRIRDEEVNKVEEKVVESSQEVITPKSEVENVPLIVSDVSSSEAHEPSVENEDEENDDENKLDDNLPTMEKDRDKTPEGPENNESREKILSMLEVDEKSAAQLPSNGTENVSHFQYTNDKIHRHYGSDTLLVACEKPESGLGISLAGNKDREKQNVFVVSVKAACPLAIKSGDELLEINGRLLTGMSHVTASSIIRECCEKHPTIEIVLRRKPGALNDCAVRSNSVSRPPIAPITDAPAISLAEESNENSVSTEEEEGEPNCQVEHKEEKEKAEEKPMAPLPPPPSSETTNENTSPNAADIQRKKSFSVERTAAIDNGRETYIEIDKDGKGLGLSIVGGADTVLGTVVIHEVYPDGAAAIDGRLKPGDQVLEVNGVSLRGVTHDQSIAYLRRTPPKVRLLIYRDVNLQLSLLDPTQIYNMFEIDLNKKAGRGLGISIVGRKNEPGVYVSEIVKGGVAEQDGRLMPGDQILEVNGKDVTGCMQEDVAAMLKTCTGKVHLKLGRWKITETANRVHAATEALAKSATTPRVGRKTNDNNNESNPMTTSAPAVITPTISPTTSKEERKDVPPPAPPMRPIITHTAPDGELIPVEPIGLSPVTEEPSSGTDFRSVQDEEKTPVTPPATTISSSVTSTNTNGTANSTNNNNNNNNNNNSSLAIDILHDLREEGSDTLLVELKKVADQQLGMGIGKRTRGILVTSLQPGSTAAEKLKVGDRIMAVNALPVTDQLSAVTFVKASGERLFLQIARPRTAPPT